MAGIFLPGSSKGGDITGVTAGVGLSGGGDSDDVTLTLDLSELSPVTPASGDSFATLDSDDANEQLTTTDALATLFAGAGMTATSAAVNVIGGNGITANANDVAITPAQTTITSIYNSALILGGDDETAIDFGTSNEIDFKADDAVRLTLTASSLYPVTNNQIDLGTASLEFKDAFFDGTVTADGFAGPLTGTASNATTVTDAAITFAKMQNVAANSILGRDANSSGVLSEVALATTQILIGDGTGFTAAALSSDVTMTNGGAVTIANNAVSLAKMAGLARGKIIYGDASGDPAALAVGSNTYVLTSDGTDIAWAAASAGAADDIGTGDAAVGIVTTVGNITIDAQANDADVIIKVDDAGASITAVTFDGSDEGNAIFANDVQLKTDGALLEFGADLDTTLTHTDGTGLTLNSTNKLTFGDAATFIHQSSDGVMTIDGEATIDLNASTAVLVSNDLKLNSDAAVLSFGADSEATVTHADDAGLTFNSDITMAADKSLNLPQGANIKFTDAITQDSIDDDDHQGIIMTFTAGSTVTQYSPVYLGTADEVHECDADAIATMPAIGVSINTSNVADGNPIEVMLLGLIRNEDFTDFGTNGAPVYVSTTVGDMTNTAPSGTDDVVQVIGHSVGEKLLFVQPCLTTIEHA